MGARQSFFEREGRGGLVAVTPKSLSANAGKRNLSTVLALGTGAVSTQTKLVGILPVAGVVTAIRFAGQSAVTGTSLTAEVKKLAADGSASTTLQSAATDIELTASNDDEIVPASLTATTANLSCDAGTLIECVITASSVTAGPGDLVVDLVYVAQEDSESSNEIATVEDSQ